MPAGRKRDAVLRLLRGGPLEIVARELAVTAADLSAWRDAFLEKGEASLKTRAQGDRDEAIDRLQTKMGELTMDGELLQAKIDQLVTIDAGPSDGSALRREGRERDQTARHGAIGWQWPTRAAGQRSTLWYTEQDANGLSWKYSCIVGR